MGKILGKFRESGWHRIFCGALVVAVISWFIVEPPFPGGRPLAADWVQLIFGISTIIAGIVEVVRARKNPANSKYSELDADQNAN